MESKTPNMYQNNLLDVFKLYKVFDLNAVTIKKKGDVGTLMVFL